MTTTPSNWWDAPIAQPYGATTDITLGNGARDIEKGIVYSIPAGSPVDLPVSGQVVWEDAQHMVVQTAYGFLNFLHINPTRPVGASFGPGAELGTVSDLKGTINLANGHTYTETGNVLEAGLYSNEQTAINRENYVNGQDVPTDFTNIKDPTGLFNSFKSGNIGTGTGSAFGNTDTSNTNNGSIPINLGPWHGSIANPVAGVETAIGHSVTGAEQFVMRMGLTAGLAIAGFVLILLVFRKQIMQGVTTAATVAA